jgi:hypothetical protein
VSALLIAWLKESVLPDAVIYRLIPSHSSTDGEDLGLRQYETIDMHMRGALSNWKKPY